MNTAIPKRFERLAILAACCASVFLVTLFGICGPTVCIQICLRAADVVVMIVWLLSAFGWGAIVVKRIELPFALRIVTSAALGLGILSLLTLFAGLLGVLSTALAWGLIAIGWVLLYFARTVFLPAEPEGEPSPVRYGWTLAMIPLAISFACAFIPPGVLWGDEPNGYDVVEYHLQVPREWYELGRIVPLTHNVFSYFPFNVEMHYLLAMQLMHGPWNGMYVAQLMHVAFFALTVAAVYALTSERSRPLAILAAVAVACTPWLTLLAPVAYNEGGLLLWGTLAIGLALRGRTQWRSMILAGAFAGLACGAKLTGVPILLFGLPIAILLTGLTWHGLPARVNGDYAAECMGKMPMPQLLLRLFAFAFAGAVTFAPWAIKDFAWTGNPVFPEATGVFGKAHWSETQVERWKRANHLPRADQQNVASRLRADWDQILGDWRYGFTLLPITLVAAGMSWRSSQTRALVLLLLFMGVFWTGFTHLQSRFFTLAIPIAGLLIGQVEWNRRNVVLLSGALLGALLGIGLTISRVMKLDKQFTVVGAPSLRGATPLEQDETRSIALVGDARAFFYDLPAGKLFYRTVFDVDAKPGESLEDAWIDGAKADAEVIDSSELIRLSKTYYDLPEPSREVLAMPPGPQVRTK